MKIWGVLIVLLLVGCGEQQANEASNESNTVSSPATVDTNQSLAKAAPTGPKTLGTACESLDTDEVATIMGWDASKTLAEEQLNMKGGRLTVCMFREDGGEVQLLVRVSHESDKAQANKVLEKAFQRALLEGEESLTYEKIPTIIGTESIIGDGEVQHGYHVYILRNRFGNALNTTIETSVFQADAETIKAQLKAIAAAMH